MELPIALGANWELTIATAEKFESCHCRRPRVSPARGLLSGNARWENFKGRTLFFCLFCGLRKFESYLWPVGPGEGACLNVPPAQLSTC